MTKIMKIHEGNPFTGDIARQLKATKEYFKEFDSKGVIAAEEVRVTYRKEYLALPFTKIFQNKELLSDLNSYCCKILVHIALNLEYNQQKIELLPRTVGMDKRKFSATMVELLSRRILAKEKRGWYWINVTLLINGKTGKDETYNPTRQSPEPDAGRE